MDLAIRHIYELKLGGILVILLTPLFYYFLKNAVKIWGKLIGMMLYTLFITGVIFLWNNDIFHGELARLYIDINQDRKIFKVRIDHDLAITILSQCTPGQYEANDLLLAKLLLYRGGSSDIARAALLFDKYATEGCIISANGLAAAIATQRLKSWSPGYAYYWHYLSEYLKNNPTLYDVGPSLLGSQPNYGYFLTSYEKYSLPKLDSTMENKDAIRKDAEAAGRYIREKFTHKCHGLR